MEMIGMIAMGEIILLAIVGVPIMVVGMILKLLRGEVSRTYYTRSEKLPNGYTRQDYRDIGMTDAEIDFWGANQPGAPGPDIGPPPDIFDF